MRVNFAAFFATFVMLMMGVQACPQRVADSWSLYGKSSHTFPFVDASPGEYIKIEVSYSPNGEDAGDNGQIVSQGNGHSVSANARSSRNTIEFFASQRQFNVVTTLDNDPDDNNDGKASAHVTVWRGLPDIVVHSLTLANQTLTCTYSIGNIPWTPIGVIPINLYYSSTSDASGIEDLHTPIASMGVQNGLNFRNATAQVQFSCTSLPLEPYGKTNIVAIFDPANVITEQSKANNSAAITWAFVEQVPEIQDRLGFPLAAQIQRAWLTGSPAFAFHKTGKNPVFSDNLFLAETTGSPGLDISTLTMDWVLDPANSTTDRVRKAKDGLLNLIGNDNALKELRKVLRPELERHIGHKVAFGNLDVIGTDLYNQATQHTDIRLSYSFDYVDHCLGNFSLYGVPCGTATMDKKGHISGTITSVGIFLGDIFEFSETQYLGTWSIMPPAVSWNPFSGGIRLGNYSYQNYRERLGRGRDTVIMSYAKAFPLPQPVTF